MARHVLRLAAPLLAAAALAAPSPARAAEPPAPEAFVRSEIDTLADVLASGRPGRLAEVRRRVRAVADFEGFARRSLGSAWTTLSPAERRRFTEALQRLLESHYMRRPATVFDRRKVAVKGATRDGDRAEVSLEVERKEAPVGVDVRLRRAPEGWIAEDVVLDGLSLLEDYRAQFRTFLKKRTVRELVERLNARASSAERGG
jgi:phospholipid transport system substrate-binding protein